MSNAAAAEAAPDDRDDSKENKSPRRLSSLVLAQVIAIVCGLLATMIYSFGAGGNWQNLSASAMVAAASLGTGAFLGLLFGVPRSIGSDQRVGDADGRRIPTIGANTNLEQISDWLTKIIVGVTLTQLAAIKRGAGRLFDAIAPALGDNTGASAFAGAVVIYFMVVGFFAGWLYARLRLGLAMSTADAWLELSRRAQSAGDPETAKAAKDAAMSVTQISAGVAAPSGAEKMDVESMASRYEELRNTTPNSPRRTARMEDLVRQMRQLAKTGGFTAQDTQAMFSLGTDGRRMVALALMEGDLTLADFGSVLQAIERSRSAFEQYHGLMVANRMLSSLSASERESLQAALTNPDVVSHWVGDTSRSAMAEQILAKLQTSG
jgi:hypothetical protein